ncbi:MAG TPA: hypothetical protein VG710_16560 [Opitutus sp.]|nr:hypothetical protein [Opitutus sp.]
MKTLPLLAFLAALAAFLFAPITIELAGSLVFAAGLACVFVADYARRASLVRARPAAVVRLAPAVGAGRRLELAA